MSGTVTPKTKDQLVVEMYLEQMDARRRQGQPVSTEFYKSTYPGTFTATELAVLTAHRSPGHSEGGVHDSVTDNAPVAAR